MVVVCGDQFVGCEGEGVVDDVVYFVFCGVEEVVCFLVGFVVLCIGVDVVEFQFLVFGGVGFFCCGVQYVLYVGYLFVVFQGKGFVVKCGVGGIVGGYGGMVQLCKCGVEVLQGLGVGVYGFFFLRVFMLYWGCCVVCFLWDWCGDVFLVGVQFVDVLLLGVV